MCNGITELYHELFSFMENEEILDPFNEIDFCLLLMTRLMPGDRHDPNTICQQ